MITKQMIKIRNPQLLSILSSGCGGAGGRNAVAIGRVVSDGKKDHLKEMVSDCFTESR